MKKNKVVTADEAIALIKDGDVVAAAGFVGNGTPEELIIALERRYKDSQSPKNLTLLFASGLGDAKDRGLNRLALNGLWKRVIAGHYGLMPKIGQMALDNAFEGYNLPQGILTNLYRAVAARRPGVLSKVGLGTFVDPRIEGGKINERAKDDLVEVVTLGGEEWLFMKAFPINVALIRGTTADASGNITFEKEILTLDTLAMASAVHNSGGIVIGQVERIAAKGSLKSKEVKVPGILVDYVVVANPENHMQTYATQYSPVLSGEIKIDIQARKGMALDERKIIARRAAMELAPFDVINLGIGVPEGVASIANEEKILSSLTMTVEPGIIGGMPTGGLDFGGSVNAESVIDMPDQFDFYDGGGLDLTCLGMAQCDASGNVNSSKFGKKLAGCGGFINISQNAKKVLFVGTLTADGLEIAVENGRLRIVSEGKVKKFVQHVQQITFSGKIGSQGDQEVYYITERAVFRLLDGQLELIEVAPGIDIDKDVLAQMEFLPVMNRVKQMDERIFDTRPMKIRTEFLTRDLDRRIQYHAEKNLLSLNFAGLEIESIEDCENIRDVATAKCLAAGKKVKAVVNYDSFSIPEELIDSYLEINKPVIDEFYAEVTRFTGNTAMREKLAQRFAQNALAPRIFGTEDEAERALLWPDLK
jgi:propionate CoA-transferase